MTMFFAVLDLSLVFMHASYTSIFYDAVLILEEHWDTVIDAVENGTFQTYTILTIAGHI